LRIRWLDEVEIWSGRILLLLVGNLFELVVDIAEGSLEGHQSIGSALSKHGKCFFIWGLLPTIRINVEW
jgi:hypothetical protein